MGFVGTVPVARHLLRAKDLADARYFEPLAVADLAAAAGLSPAHFSRQFKATFGESPHQYLRAGAHADPGQAHAG
jgi:AraC-like DNA-binding protein